MPHPHCHFFKTREVCVVNVALEIPGHFDNFGDVAPFQDDVAHFGWFASFDFGEGYCCLEAWTGSVLSG
jgi:hypothetical protein